MAQKVFERSKTSQKTLKHLKISQTERALAPKVLHGLRGPGRLPPVLDALGLAEAALAHRHREPADRALLCLKV